MNPTRAPVQIDLVLQADSMTLWEVIAPHSPNSPYGETEKVHWHGVIDLPADRAMRLRTYAVLTPSGEASNVRVSGHEIDSSDPSTFRVFRFERNERVCVAAFSRGSTVGVIEVSAMPAKLTPAVSSQQSPIT